jgi:hypothetical protein
MRAERQATLLAELAAVAANVVRHQWVHTHDHTWSSLLVFAGNHLCVGCPGWSTLGGPECRSVRLEETPSNGVLQFIICAGLPAQCVTWAESDA